MVEWQRKGVGGVVAAWILGSVIPIVCALVLAHFAERVDDYMDYDGGRPSVPTPEQVDAQRFTVGIVASNIAGRA